MSRPAPAFPDLSHLALPGTEISLRVAPGARRNAIERDAQGELRAHVTAAPENGRANRAVQQLLAQALVIAPSRLCLVRGETSRLKVFRVE
ncbi:MAG: DUF167 domain-containing protein [Pseudorhodobacter sp.]